MPFGKHRGKDLTEIDRGYLQWLLTLSGLSLGLRCDVEDEIERRECEATSSRAEIAINVLPILNNWRRKLALKFHPDLRGGSNEAMGAINVGYDMLVNMFKDEGVLQ